MLYNSGDEYAGISDNNQADTPKSSNIESKTNSSKNNKDNTTAAKSEQAPPTTAVSGENNILNGYRSVTYNFTLAALKKDYLENPESLRESELDLVILKSGGKGIDGMTGIPAAQSPVYDRYDAKVKKVATDISDTISGFNTNSPGRFDMFIDDVELTSLMSFSAASNTSMPTKIRFNVVEPYSMNGFIEALYVSAIAAGYTSYLAASFVLKLEFKGYPDNDQDSFQSPVTIPNSTRYFPIGLTGVDVTVNEKGTNYSVQAVPFNERSFGQQNVLNKSVKMQGSTVQEILKNLISTINDLNEKSFKESKPNGSINQIDKYDIKFVDWSETDGWVPATNSKIASAKVVELLNDNALYSMADPGNSNKPDAYKTKGKAQPSPQENAKNPATINLTNTTVQFSENMNIHDIIIAVIRDSQYTREIISKIKENTDSYGMVTYFMVRIETTNTGINNEETKKPVQKITYVVSPYKIHFSKIPNLSDNLIKEEELKQLSVREYNYIYTGQNVDVISFNLNFNTLFFEAVPVAMGKKDVPEAKTSAANNNNTQVIQGSPSNADVSKLQVPSTPKLTKTTPIQYYGSNASQPLDDPYSILARNMHNAVVNSKGSMLTGELEILGDPFYLVTGGMGNYNPKPIGLKKMKSGEANHLYSQLLININFRNPVDIMTFEQGGRMYFDSNRVPFSGVYQVTEVVSNFKNGVFKQKLNVLRMPGQILDQNVSPTDITNSIKAVPDSNSVKTADATRSFAPSQRIDTPTSLAQLNRGLPSPGLPGAFSNFTNATGGLGGTSSSLLNRTYGVVGRDGNLFSGVAGAAAPLPTDVNSNIRLNSSGFFDLNNSNLSTVALTNVAANIITGNVPFKQAVGSLVGTAIGKSIGSILNRPNVGSGIGSGATVSINEPTVDSADATMNDIRSGNLINDVSLPSDSINNVSSVLNDLGTGALNAVTSIGNDAKQLVGNIGNKLKSLSSTPADPNGVAASIGINPSAISGLSPTLQSKVLSEAKQLADSVPADVNLRQAANAGLVLDYIPKSKIENIPATPPFSTAPSASSVTDNEYINNIVSTKGIAGLENLYGVNDVSKLSSNLVPSDVISTALRNVPNAEINPYKNMSGIPNSVDASVWKDKFGSASQLTNLTNIKDKNTTGAIGNTLGSLSRGQSPLDKLVNKLGDPNAAPYTGDDPIIRNRLGLPPKG